VSFASFSFASAGCGIVSPCVTWVASKSRLCVDRSFFFFPHRGERHNHVFEYVEWAKKIAAGLCGTSSWLEQQPDDASKKAEG
jgi:hypothetical protein